jgi:hypothetical protein
MAVQGNHGLFRVFVAILKLVAVCFAHGHGVYRIYTDSDPVFKALRAALRQWASYSA